MDTTFKLTTTEREIQKQTRDKRNAQGKIFLVVTPNKKERMSKIGRYAAK